MGLALEVKKFINSEHTGDYVEITLPGTIEPPRGKNADGAAGPQNEVMRMHYVDEGSGEPLLLVHTVSQSLYTWRRVYQRLSEHYRVIAVDLPGHGYSDRPITFGYTIDEYADVIGRFLDALNIRSTHIMAFSMGGAYAAKFALTHPERVGRLVLLTPGGVTGEMPLPIRMIDNPLLGFVASMLYGLRTVEKILYESVFDLTNITPDVVQSYYRPASDPEARRAIRLSVQHFDDSEVVANLRNIEADTLILLGSEDTWHLPALVEVYHAAIRNAGFALVRNAGHLIHEEKPERIVTALLEFIPVDMPE